MAVPIAAPTALVGGLRGLRAIRAFLIDVLVAELGVDDDLCEMEWIFGLRALSGSNWLASVKIRSFHQEAAT